MCRVVLSLCTILLLVSTAHAEQCTSLGTVGPSIDLSDGITTQRLNAVISYNSVINEYMVVWFDLRNSSTGGNDIFGQRVAADGSRVGVNIPIMEFAESQTEPAIAFNHFANEYLVTWQTQQAGNFNDARGRRVAGDGTLVGGDFFVGEGFEVSLAFNEADLEFMHTGRGGGIIGQRISNTGTLQGGALPIGPPGVAPNGTVTYDNLNNRYLVTWRQQSVFSLQGQIVNADGSLFGGPFEIAPVTTSGYQASQAAYDPVAGRFLVVYNDVDSGGIWARLVTSSGQLIGGSISLGGDLGATNADVAFNSLTRSFVVVWEEAGNILARAVAGNGTAAGEILQVASSAVSIVAKPRIAFNSANREYLLTWSDNRNMGQGIQDIFAQRIACIGAYCQPGDVCDEVVQAECAWLGGNFHAEQKCWNVTCSMELCANASPIHCGETQVRAVSGVGHVASYGCVGFSYDGSHEAVYELVLTGTSNLAVEMLYSHGPGNDLDLFLLGSCDPGDCLLSSTATNGVEQLSASGLAPGTYYIVVDGFSGSQDGSSHSLTVLCDGGLCDRPEPILCGEMQIRSVQGAGNVVGYGCSSPFYDNAMEQVYEIALPTGGDLTVDMSYDHHGANDLDLFLLNSCNPNDCLFSATGVTGHEQINATGLPPGPYYVVIDGYMGRQDGSEHVVTVACSAGLCSHAVPIGCGESQQNAVRGPGEVDFYGCESYNYSGAMEFVYEVTLPLGGELTVDMEYEHNAGNDLDLFLLGSCDPANCLASSTGSSGTEQVHVAGLPPGAYVIVVDGYSGFQDGSPHWITVTCVEPNAVSDGGLPPLAFKLHHNVPNPFNPVTLIRYDLPTALPVRLAIYDAAGRLVQLLVDERSQAGGRHAVRWEGRDRRGQGVASGVYFYRLTAGEYERTRSMVLLR